MRIQLSVLFFIHVAHCQGLCLIYQAPQLLSSQYVSLGVVELLTGNERPNAKNMKEEIQMTRSKISNEALETHKKDFTCKKSRRLNLL